MPASRKPNIDDVLLAVVDTAIEIACADFGHIQLVDKKTGVLRIVAQRGFSSRWVDYWDRQKRGKSAFDYAVFEKKRIIVENINKSSIISDPQVIELQLKAGVRAIQATPLFSWNGDLIGVFSTHYKKPWRPTGPILRTLDTLARLAALVIEHSQSK